MLAARAQSPYDFKVETPINKLSVPVNFTQTVYAEATKSVALSFWQMTDLQAPDHLRRFMGFYADSHDNKATYKITLDWKERTATVTENFIDVNDQAKESLEAFKITNFDIQNVCLMRIESNGFVDVITIGAELGSFMETECSAPGFLKYHGTAIWYGTCRN
jgi:hypothetical protein